jgi:hypothetical protein
MWFQLQERAQSLQEREQLVSEEVRRAEFIQRNAQLKEQEIMTVYQQVRCACVAAVIISRLLFTCRCMCSQTESQRSAMKDMEDDFQRRKLALASQRRELARLQSDADKRNLHSTLTKREDIHGGNSSGYPSAEKENMRRLDVGMSADDLLDRLAQKHSPIDISRGGGAPTGNTPKRQNRSSYQQEQQKVDSHGWSHRSEEQAAITLDEDHNTICGIDRLTWESEVASARRTMQAARGGVARMSLSRYHNDGVIRTESDFLSKIRRK